MPTTLLALPQPSTLITKSKFKSEVEFWLQDWGIEVKGIIIRPLKRSLCLCSEDRRITCDSSLLEKSVKFRKQVVSRAVMNLELTKTSRLTDAITKAYLGETNLV